MGTTHPWSQRPEPETAEAPLVVDFEGFIEDSWARYIAPVDCSEEEEYLMLRGRMARHSTVGYPLTMPKMREWSR